MKRSQSQDCCGEAHICPVQSADWPLWLCNHPDKGGLKITHMSTSEHIKIMECQRNFKLQESQSENWNIQCNLQQSWVTHFLGAIKLDAAGAQFFPLLGSRESVDTPPRDFDIHMNAFIRLFFHPCDPDFALEMATIHKKIYTQKYFHSKTCTQGLMMISTIKRNRKGGAALHTQTAVWIFCWNIKNQNILLFQ